MAEFGADGSDKPSSTIARLGSTCESQRLWRCGPLNGKLPNRNAKPYRSAHKNDSQTAASKKAGDGDGPGWCHSEVQFPAGPRVGRFLPDTTKGMCSARFLSSAFVAVPESSHRPPVRLQFRALDYFDGQRTCERRESNPLCGATPLIVPSCLQIVVHS